MTLEQLAERVQKMENELAELRAASGIVGNGMQTMRVADVVLAALRLSAHESIFIESKEKPVALLRKAVHMAIVRKCRSGRYKDRLYKTRVSKPKNGFEIWRLT